VLKDFREFAIKGNAMDLAVGVIIGAAFGAVVNSLVTDVIMPPVGMATGGVDFKDHFVSLNGQAYASLAAAKAAGAPVLAYGNFINTILNFLIVAFAVYMLVKQINRFRGPAEVTTKSCPYCTNAIPLKATRCPLCTSEVK
jgi:large conductance mechanosensitive channel